VGVVSLNTSITPTSNGIRFDNTWSASAVKGKVDAPVDFLGSTLCAFDIYDLQLIDGIVNSPLGSFDVNWLN